MSRKLFVVILAFSIAGVSKADSPLTSTSFAFAYYDVPIVKTATKSSALTTELMDYLIDNNPLDVKMAIINQLGWSSGGQNNAEIFAQYLMKKKGYKSQEEIFDKGNSHEILCMAYLKALDDYFEVEEAYAWAQKALRMNPKSYTCNIIAALIQAQSLFNDDWCEVFKATDKVRKDPSLKIDMRQDAMEIIFEYMDLYEEACGEE